MNHRQKCQRFPHQKFPHRESVLVLVLVLEARQKCQKCHRQKYQKLILRQLNNGGLLYHS
jgi:hypothetical protein